MSVTASARSPVAVPSEAAGFHGAYVRGEPAALAFLPRHLSREGDWEERIEEAERCSPAKEVWMRAADEGEALDADAVARDNAESLARGGPLCVVAGQQPGLFLGPLYTVYKAMTAVVLARRVEEKSGKRTVPVFWNAADDSDFGEVGSAHLPGADFRLTRHSLDGGDLSAGGMVGDLGTAGTRAALEEARTSWEHHPYANPIVQRLEAALARAADHGQLASAILHDLFRGTGLVVVDGRWPELRRLAAPLLERYAESRDEAARRVVGAGEALEAAGFRPRIQEASTKSGLFDVRTGRRLAFEGSAGELAERIRTEPETLSPNVMLRALVQDSLFPNVATVAGPGEITYHAQLAPEYELLGVAMPILFPRFEATLVPEGVYWLAEQRSAPVAEFVRDFDGAMRDTAVLGISAGLRDAIEGLERGWNDGIARVRGEAEAFDAKLEGAVADAEKRVRAALEKLRQKAVQAARSSVSRRDPAIKAYREFLRPRGVPQERVLSSLTLFLQSGDHPLDCLKDALEKHLVSSRESEPVHWLLDFSGCREAGAP